MNATNRIWTSLTYSILCTNNCHPTCTSSMQKYKLTNLIQVRRMISKIRLCILEFKDFTQYFIIQTCIYPKRHFCLIFSSASKCYKTNIQAGIMTLAALQSVKNSIFLFFSFIFTPKAQLKIFWTICINKMQVATPSNSKLTEIRNLLWVLWCALLPNNGEWKSLIDH